MLSLLIYLCLLWNLSSAAPLLILMLEAFRWDYLDIYGRQLQDLGRLANGGVRVEYLEPDFPTNSLTNEYTLMTGLYNDYHGMLSYSMYDPQRNETFQSKKPPPFWWENAEPIWIAAERQNKYARIFNWPFCDIELNKIKASHCDFLKRKGGIWPQLTKALSSGMISISKKSADLLGIFVKATDIRAKLHGPRSKEFASLMTRLNKLFIETMRDINIYNLTDVLNILVVSGFGLTDVSPDQVIRITDYVDEEDVIRFTGDGAVVGVWPRSGTLEKVYNSLRSAHVNMTVYKKEESPKHWHYRRHPRIAPILVTTEEGWTILKGNERLRTFGKRNKLQMGNHGYDNLFVDMRGTFIAYGPAFKSSYTSRPIKAVDVYQVICKLLDITPSPHNGSWERVKDMFKSGSDSTYSTTISTILIALCLLTLYFIQTDEFNGAAREK